MRKNVVGMFVVALTALALGLLTSCAHTLDLHYTDNLGQRPKPAAAAPSQATVILRMLVGPEGRNGAEAYLTALGLTPCEIGDAIAAALGLPPKGCK